MLMGFFGEFIIQRKDTTGYSRYVIVKRNTPPTPQKNNKKKTKHKTTKTNEQNKCSSSQSEKIGLSDRSRENHKNKAFWITRSLQENKGPWLALQGTPQFPAFFHHHSVMVILTVFYPGDSTLSVRAPAGVRQGELKQIIPRIIIVYVLILEYMSLRVYRSWFPYLLCPGFIGVY